MNAAITTVVLMTRSIVSGCHEDASKSNPAAAAATTKAASSERLQIAVTENGFEPEDVKGAGPASRPRSCSRARPTRPAPRTSRRGGWPARPSAAKLGKWTVARARALTVRFEHATSRPGATSAHDARAVDARRVTDG